MADGYWLGSAAGALDLLVWVYRFRKMLLLLYRVSGLLTEETLALSRFQRSVSHCELNFRWILQNDGMDMRMSEQKLELEQASSQYHPKMYL